MKKSTNKTQQNGMNENWFSVIAVDVFYVPCQKAIKVPIGNIVLTTFSGFKKTTNNQIDEYKSLHSKDFMVFFWDTFFIIYKLLHVSHTNNMNFARTLDDF